MTNPKIVAKGEQIKAIDVELADVNEQIEILQAKANMLANDKKQLTNKIAELKQTDNQLANEQLVNEWVNEMVTKFNNKITVNYDNLTRRSHITVSLDHQAIPQFVITNNMSESQVKDYLHEIENTIKLFNELTAQNVFESLNLSYAYISENSFYTVIMPNNDNSNKSISLRLHDNGLVNVKIEDHVYDMPRYKAELKGGLTLVPVAVEDEYGEDIDEYPFELHDDMLINIDVFGNSLKLMLDNFENSKNKFIKPFK